MQTLPRKVMEQCRLCPAKSQSLRFLPCKITETLLFAPQNYGAMQTLLRKKTATQFQGLKNILELKFLHFFLFFFVNHCFFRDLYNPLDHLLRKKIFCVTVPLRFISFLVTFALTYGGRISSCEKYPIDQTNRIPKLHADVEIQFVAPSLSLCH